MTICHSILWASPSFSRQDVFRAQKGKFFSQFSYCFLCEYGYPSKLKTNYNSYAEFYLESEIMNTIKLCIFIYITPWHVDKLQSKYINLQFISGYFDLATISPLLIFFLGYSHNSNEWIVQPWRHLVSFYCFWNIPKKIIR